jgi:hypothetical protein
MWAGWDAFDCLGCFRLLTEKKLVWRYALLWIQYCFVSKLAPFCTQNTSKDLSRYDFLLITWTSLGHKFDLFAISESWLNPTHADAEVCIPDYQLHRHDREFSHRGGGTAIYIKNTIICNRVYPLHNTVGISIDNLSPTQLPCWTLFTCSTTKKRS